MRFSKAALQRSIQHRVDNIQKRYGFDPDSGTGQLEYIAEHVGCDIVTTTCQYGSFRELIDIASEFGLSVYTRGNYRWKCVVISGGCDHYKYVGEHEKA